MTESHRQLIDLYARGSVDDVHATPSYRRLCREHEADRAFDRERLMVEELRRQVDGFVGRRESHRDQGELGLRLLRRVTHPDERIVCRELGLLTDDVGWDPGQRIYFETMSLDLAARRHYFLSFTNRNSNRPNLNQVNRDHRFFIIETLGQAAYDRADLRTPHVSIDDAGLDVPDDSASENA